MTATTINTTLPSDPSEYAFHSTDVQRTFDEESIAHETALELGFFELIAPHFKQLDESTLDDFRVSAPEKIHQQVRVDNICGLVSATPLAIQIPDDCRYLKVETSGRVWFSASGQAPVSTQTLDVAQSQRSIGIIGNGIAKIINRPLGLSTFYVSAYPDNSEVSISFISGTVKYSDIS